MSWKTGCLLFCLLVHALGIGTTKFVAADPNCYDHAVGGGSFNDGSLTYVSSTLAAGDFACGDYVSFLFSVKMTATTDTITNGYVEVQLFFSAAMTQVQGLAFTQIPAGHVYIQKPRVGYVNGDGCLAGTRGTTCTPTSNCLQSTATSYDSGVASTGTAENVTLVRQWLSGAATFNTGSQLNAAILISGVDKGDQVVIRVDVELGCDTLFSGATGVLQAGITNAWYGTTLSTDKPAYLSATGTIDLSNVYVREGATHPSDVISAGVVGTSGDKQLVTMSYPTEIKSCTGCQCKGAVDVWILVDHSGSISDAEMVNLKTTFVEPFLRKLSIAPDQANVGMSWFHLGTGQDFPLTGNRAVVQAGMNRWFTNCSASGWGSNGRPAKPDSCQYGSTATATAFLGYNLPTSHYCYSRVAFPTIGSCVDLFMNQSTRNAPRIFITLTDGAVNRKGAPYSITGSTPSCAVLGCEFEACAPDLVAGVNLLRRKHTETQPNTPLTLLSVGIGNVCTNDPNNCVSIAHLSTLAGNNTNNVLLIGGFNVDALTSSVNNLVSLSCDGNSQEVSPTCPAPQFSCVNFQSDLRITSNGAQAIGKFYYCWTSGKMLWRVGGNNNISSSKLKVFDNYCTTSHVSSMDTNVVDGCSTCELAQQYPPTLQPPMCYNANSGYYLANPVQETLNGVAVWHYYGNPTYVGTTGVTDLWLTVSTTADGYNIPVQLKWYDGQIFTFSNVVIGCPADSVFNTPTTTCTAYSCARPLDLVIVEEISQNTDATKQAAVKTFLTNLVGKFVIGSGVNNARVGLMNFSATTGTIIDLNTGVSSSAVNSALGIIGCLAGTPTAGKLYCSQTSATSKPSTAIIAATAMFSAQSTNTRGKVILVVLNQIGEPTSAISAAVSAAAAQGISVVAVTYGSFNIQQELESLVTDPGLYGVLSDNLWRVAYLTNLTSTALLTGVSARICGLVPISTVCSSCCSVLPCNPAAALCGGSVCATPTTCPVVYATGSTTTLHCGITNVNSNGCCSQQFTNLCSGGGVNNASCYRQVCNMNTGLCSVTGGCTYTTTDCSVPTCLQDTSGLYGCGNISSPPAKNPNACETVQCINRVWTRVPQLCPSGSCQTGICNTTTGTCTLIASVDPNPGFASPCSPRSCRDGTWQNIPVVCTPPTCFTGGCSNATAGCVFTALNCKTNPANLCETTQCTAQGTCPSAPTYIQCPALPATSCNLNNVCNPSSGICEATGQKVCVFNQTSRCPTQCIQGVCTPYDCPVDCAWSSWGAYSSCSVTCAQGTKTRTRTSTPAQFGGTVCVPTDGTDTQACNDGPCPIDCVWNPWSAYSSCSVTCGPGTQTATRSISVQAQYNGVQCTDLTNTTNVINCNLGICPVNCVWGAWSAFSPCNVSCPNGGTLPSRSGYFWHNRTIAVAQAGSGSACSGPANESLACTINCPVNCSWSAWSANSSCTVSCGGGVLWRSRTEAVSAQNGGSSCLGLSNDTLLCNPQPCPINCVGSFSNASCACDGLGNNWITSTFTITTQAQFGGSACAYANNYKQNYTVSVCGGACARVNCVGNWGSWTSCDCSTRANLTRVFNITTPAKNGGTPCPFTNGQIDVDALTCNFVTGCAADCIYSVSTWSICDCNTFTQNRSYTILSNPVTGAYDGIAGKACPNPLESRACDPGCCVGGFGNFGVCDCFGYQYASYVITTQQSGTGTACPYSAGFTINQTCCPNDCEWSQWTVQSPCNAVCSQPNPSATGTLTNIRSRTGAQALCSPSSATQDVACTIACAVDCVWSAWTANSTCTATCGGGTLFRNRTQSIVAQNGGASCAGLASEVMACATQFCPVVCVGAFSNSSCQCDGTGYEWVTSTFSISIEAANGGTPCDHLNGFQLNYTVDTGTCGGSCTQQNCAGSWSSYSDCNCLTGAVSKRVFTITTPALNGGEQCLFKNQETQDNPTPCDYSIAFGGCHVDCAYHYDAWGICDCSTNLTTRNLVITQPPVDGSYDMISGALCPPNIDTKPCTPGCCVGAWTSWGGCDCNGYEYSTFVVSVSQSGDGLPCAYIDGTVQNQTGCCPSNCAWSQWSVKTPCSVTCPTIRGTAPYLNGTQVNTRTRTGVQATCDPNPTEDDTVACSVLCPVDCTWSAWSANSTCTVTCGGGTLYHTRTENIEQNGGDSCVGEANETLTCNTQPCPVDCVGHWSNSSCQCDGLGNNWITTTYIITTQAANGGNSCPAASGDNFRYNGVPCGGSCAPVACQGAFGAWTTCDCSTRVNLTRTYVISSPAKNGGAACAHENGYTETNNTCDFNAGCHINCGFTVSAWGVCDCTTNLTTRSVTITHDPTTGIYDGITGTACPPSTQTQSCAPGCCIGHWTPYGACDCVNGVQYRSYVITIPQSGDGTACEFADATIQNISGCQSTCPTPCVGDWGPDGACQCSSQKRIVRKYVVSQPATNGGAACPYTNGEEDTVLTSCSPDEIALCPVNCSGEWTSWTSCDCTTEKRSRTWLQLIPAQNGGEACAQPAGYVDTPSCTDDDIAVCRTPVCSSTSCPATACNLYQCSVINLQLACSVLQPRDCAASLTDYCQVDLGCDSTVGCRIGDIDCATSNVPHTKCEILVRDPTYPQCCRPVPKPCPNGNPCQESTCDLTTGNCVARDACVSTDPCIKSICTATGCVTGPYCESGLQDDTQCITRKCTVSDGVPSCGALTLGCQGSDPCIVGTCTNGTCSFAPKCQTTTDKCINAGCSVNATSGEATCISTPVYVPPNTGCRSAACDSSTGVSITLNTSLCENGNPCEIWTCQDNGTCTVKKITTCTHENASFCNPAVCVDYIGCTTRSYSCEEDGGYVIDNTSCEIYTCVDCDPKDKPCNDTTPQKRANGPYYGYCDQSGASCLEVFGLVGGIAAGVIVAIILCGILALVLVSGMTYALATVTATTEAGVTSTNPLFQFRGLAGENPLHRVASTPRRGGGWTPRWGTPSSDVVS